jgi:hypothetical protein
MLVLEQEADGLAGRQGRNSRIMGPASAPQDALRRLILLGRNSVYQCTITFGKHKGRENKSLSGRKHLLVAERPRLYGGRK